MENSKYSEASHIIIEYASSRFIIISNNEILLVYLPFIYLYTSILYRGNYICVHINLYKDTRVK